MKTIKSIRYDFFLRAKGFFRGIDMIAEEHSDASRIDNDYFQYMPLFQYYVKKITDNLKITHQDCILDYGSGKGIAMLFFARYPFQKIDGVELIPKLHAAAESNFQKKGLSHLSSHNTEATLFDAIDQYTYFFFYNPFKGEVMKKVLEMICVSLRRAPRETTIIYQNPVEKQAFIQSGLFPYIKQYAIASPFQKTLRARNYIDVYSTIPHPSLKNIEKYEISGKAI